MREALHIFLKDTRQLRYPIGILMIWTAVFVVAGTQVDAYQGPGGGLGAAFGAMVAFVSTYVFPVGWAYVICRAVQADALPGDRQFWLTRPYSRTSLLGAKAMFAAAYVTVPFMVAQSAIVVLHGLPLSSYLAGLLWEQVLIAVVVILPAATLAAVTSTLVQFVVVTLVVPVLFIAGGMMTPWSGFEWIRTTVGASAAVAVAVTVLRLQVKRRRTAWSRAIAVVGLVTTMVGLALIPWRTAFAFQARMAHRGPGALAVEIVRPERKTAATTRYTQLVYRVTGPPTGTPIACETQEIEIEAPDGSVWRGDGNTGGYGQRALGYERRSSVPDGCVFGFRIPPAFRDSVGNRPVTIRSALYVTVFTRASTTVPVGGPATAVPNLGFCSAVKRTVPRILSGMDTDQVTSVACGNAFRNLPFLMNSPQGEWFAQPRRSYSPFPAELVFHPVMRRFADFRPVDHVTITTLEPIAHERLPVVLSGVSLLDFEL